MNVGGCLVLLAAVVLAFGFAGARKPLDDYRLLLVFENGEQRIFDVKPYLQRGVFTRLQNLAAFRSARVVAGSVEWLGELDLSYDTLYLESQPVSAQVTPETTPA